MPINLTISGAHTNQPLFFLYLTITILIVVPLFSLLSSLNSYNYKKLKPITVLVEDGLRAGKYEYLKHQDGTVLILVLVEDGLRGQKMQCDDH